jgi:hypothetical protein
VTPPFITSALDGGECTASGPSRFTPPPPRVKNHRHSLGNGLADPIDYEDNRTLRESTPGRAIRRLADCATSAPAFKHAALIID